MPRILRDPAPRDRPSPWRLLGLTWCCALLASSCGLVDDNDEAGGTLSASDRRQSTERITGKVEKNEHVNLDAGKFWRKPGSACRLVVENIFVNWNASDCDPFIGYCDKDKVSFRLEGTVPGCTDERGKVDVGEWWETEAVRVRFETDRLRPAKLVHYEIEIEYTKSPRPSSWLTLPGWERPAPEPKPAPTPAPGTPSLLCGAGCNLDTHDCVGVANNGYALRCVEHAETDNGCGKYKPGSTFREVPLHAYRPAWEFCYKRSTKWTGNPELIDCASLGWMRGVDAEARARIAALSDACNGKPTKPVKSANLTNVCIKKIDFLYKDTFTTIIANFPEQTRSSQPWWARRQDSLVGTEIDVWAQCVEDPGTRPWLLQGDGEARVCQRLAGSNDKRPFDISRYFRPQVGSDACAGIQLSDGKTAQIRIEHHKTRSNTLAEPAGWSVVNCPVNLGGARTQTVGCASQFQNDVVLIDVEISSP